MIPAMTPALKSRLTPMGMYCVLLIALEMIYGRYFPNYYGTMGFDFGITNPALLDGAYWFWKNGFFSIPWFTPSFCGGQPFFADPQSAYFSPMQWLAFFVNPTRAAHITLLLSCSIGYWAFYFLARNVFFLSISAAIVAGALAMLNGFIPHRAVTGELYQLFFLNGFVAHALLSPNHWHPWKGFRLGNAFWAGLAITMMLQASLTTLMIPMAFGILAIACIARINSKGISFLQFLVRGTLACVFSLALSASKIIASLTFMSRFPRDEYLMPGFSSLTDALLYPLFSLVLSSENLWHRTNSLLVNLQWQVFPHELSYQFGFVFLGLLLTGLIFSRRNSNTPSDDKTRLGATRNQKVIFGALLVAILFIPGMLLWYDPSWNSLLKTIPIVKTTSYPFRWIIIFIPVGCIGGAFAWNTIERSDINPEYLKPCLLLFILCMIIESELTDRVYYAFPPSISADKKPVTHQQYPFEPGPFSFKPDQIDQAWASGKRGNIPPVSSLREYVIGIDTWFNRNNVIAAGSSMIHCYNPVFGYKSEKLPADQFITNASVLYQYEGHLNIRKPACLIWPDENQCASISDAYSTNEMDEATRFVERSPIKFNISQQQYIGNLLNIGAIIICVAGLLGFIIHLFRADKRS